VLLYCESGSSPARMSSIKARTLRRIPNTDTSYEINIDIANILSV